MSPVNRPKQDIYRQRVGGHPLPIRNRRATRPEWTAHRTALLSRYPGETLRDF